MSVEIRVYIEESGELVKLRLSPENAEKAALDPAYLQELVHEEFTKRSEKYIDEEMGEIDAQSSSVQSPHGDVATADTDSGNKSLFIWTSKCIDLLLARYKENMQNFDSGRQTHKKIWTKISSTMKSKGYNVNWAQCQSKLNGLKRTYKKIIDYNSISGNDRKNWPHFERMHEIFGLSGWAQPKAIATEAGPEPSTFACSDQPKCSQITKKRKTLMDVQDFLSEMKKDRKAAREEKQRRREEMLKERNEKIDEILRQKEKQHEEKMEMMRLWLQAVTAKKEDSHNS